MEQMPIPSGKKIESSGSEFKTAIEALRTAIQAGERDDSEALQLIRQIEDPVRLAKLYDEHRARITEAAEVARTALSTLEENPSNFETNKVKVEQAIEALLRARQQIQPATKEPVIDPNTIKRHV